MAKVPEPHPFPASDPTSEKPDGNRPSLAAPAPVAQYAALDLGLMEMADVARALGKSVGTIRNWVGQRRIPFVMLGNRAVFRRQGIEEWLQKMEVKAHDSD